MRCGSGRLALTFSTSPASSSPTCGLAGEVLVGGEADPLALGPFRDHRVADAQDRGEPGPAVAQHDALADEGRELELVLDELRARSARPGRCVAMSLTRSMTTSRPLSSKKPASPVRIQPSAVSVSRVAASFLK